MNAVERSELIKSLIYDYYANKVNDKVWMREQSGLYLVSKGKLIGCLTAFEMDMEEDEEGITIKTQKSGKTVMRFDFLTGEWK